MTRFVKYMERLKFRQGQYLSKEGEQNTFIYFLKKGEYEVTKTLYFTSDNKSSYLEKKEATTIEGQHSKKAGLTEKCLGTCHYLRICDKPKLFGHSIFDEDEPDVMLGKPKSIGELK